MSIKKIFEGRWPQFKQEFLPLLFLISTNVAFLYYFPLYTRLGSLWGTVAFVTASVVTSLFLLFLFLFPEKYASVFNFSYFDRSKNADVLKRGHRISFACTMFLAMFFVWYMDLYGASNTYYALCFVYWLVTYVLISRAVQRYTKKND